MVDKARVHAKTPEIKQKCSNSCKQNPSYNSSDFAADRILQLQRTAGNQAVQRLIKSGALQAKLKISQPGDIYEQEADKVAEQVMRMPEPTNQRRQLLITPLIQRQVDEKETLLTKETDAQTPTVTPSIESRVSELQGGGQPLDPVTRAFFEPRFGQDFNGVKVHTGKKAAETARAVNARAFTVGKDVVFGDREYSPDTKEGKLLLSHELTHVTQQSINMNTTANTSGDKINSQNIPSFLQREISFELRDAPKQSVPTTLKELSEDEMRVLAWLRKHKDKIVAAEKTYCIDRRAIAGAIAWEALQNVKSGSLRAVGPGKAHIWTFWETTTLEQTVKDGYLPPQTMDYVEMLATPEGSINAIAAIMKADADAISQYDINIYRDPGMLATFYNAWTLEEVRELAKKKVTNCKPHEVPRLMPNEMGIWVYNHHIFLEEAVGKPSTSASTCYSGSPLAIGKEPSLGQEPIGVRVHTDAAAIERYEVPTVIGQTTTLNNKLKSFIEDLKMDPTYGNKVEVKSTIRSIKEDAYWTIFNQKNNRNYYKIYSPNWQEAILAAIKDRNLDVAIQFDAAVSSLYSWLTVETSKDPKVSAHASGRAVDFALRDEDFKNFIETEAKKRGFHFDDETKEKHYHVQIIGN